MQRARRSFQTGKTKPLEFRLQQLKNLLRFISERRKDIAAAVKKDLGKVSLELFIKKKRVTKVTSSVINVMIILIHRKEYFIVFPDPN